MKIKIKEINQKITEGLLLRDLSQDDAKIISDALIEAETRGKKTHGINKVFTMEKAIRAVEGRPEVIKDKGNYAFIDGHKQLGHISANFAVDILLKKVKEFDNAVVGVKNSFYYTMAGIYAEKVAREGYVALILNNGGPSSVSAFGGVDPILGTNPIAIGIPTKNDPIVLDMTTGEKPWGEINLAKVEERNLQPNTFLDKDGKFTTDPQEAIGIIPFGGYKGYGLNFMFEILTGAMVSSKMGYQTKNSYDLGFLFLAYSPTMFGTKEDFENEVEQLVKDVKSSRRAQGFSKILLPGESSKNKMRESINMGEIEVKDETWNKLLSFALGEDIEKKIDLKQ
jgi:ureidoglycolate dehydrogenase (NAD+)/L-2-hydroxycarboxylate dehydrogenase (NAD+)